MTEHESKLLDQYYLESVPLWGREVATIDNEKLSGVLSEASRRHREAIMRELAAIPDGETGREARRLFAAAYDAEIDFSIPTR